jgi:heme-degrading monooxygenase HmoA
MVIILTRRCVRPEKERWFIENWQRHWPRHPGFLNQTLTRVSCVPTRSEAMHGLRLQHANCTTYLNIAYWRSAADFEDCFSPLLAHDPEYECCDRHRAVLDRLTEVGRRTFA